MATTYGVKEGLNSEWVYKTVPLENGEIYVSTQRGLALFDGYRFIKNDHIQTSTLGLFAQKNWIYFFDSNSLQKTTHIHQKSEILLSTKKTDDNPNNDHFENIFMDSGNRIWSTDFEYVKYIDPKTNQLHAFPFYPGNKNLLIDLSILEIKKGEVWLFSPNGLWVWEENTNQLKQHPSSSLNQLKFTTAFQLKNGDILMGTQEGKNFLYEEKKNQLKPLPNLPNQEKIIGFSEFKNGWFALSNEKIFEYTQHEFQKIYEVDQPNLRQLSIDPSTGILWISTTKGLLKLAPVHPSIRNISFGNPDSPIISITKDNQQRIWALNQSNEVWKIEGNEATKIEVKSSGKFYQINFSQNQLFLSTSDGIYMGKGTHFQKLNIPVDSQQDVLKTIISPQNELWVVYTTKELDRWTWPSLEKIDKGFKNEPNFWTDNKWQDIQIDQYQRIWLVGWMPKSFGITYFDPEKNLFYDISKNKKLNPDNGLFVGDYFTKIGQGLNGNMIFSAYGGCNITNSMGKLLERIDIYKYDILDTHIRGISTDSKGNIYFGTGEGLHVLRPDLDKVFRFSKIDGLPSDYVVNSFYQDGFEKIYMGNEGGLTEFNLENALQTQLKNRLGISQILVNGNPRVLQNNFLELSKDERDILIQFSDYSFLEDGKLMFRYQFSDEENWHELTKPELNLTHFQPGKYDLVIEAIDNLGNVQAETLNIKILAHPPFLKSNLFYVLVFALVLGILYGINRYLWKKQNEKQAYLNKIKEAEMKTLRSQMNPHFLFNTLNSINSYIIQHKTDDASSYLTTFSKLMRNILDNSKHEQITLKNELDSLKLYLKLESVRLEESFDYVFKVDSSVSSEFVMIPPLIIQPFAENAIWHGLRNLKSGGLLEIRVEQNQEKDLIIKVVDNGIGRVESMKLKQNETQHKSYGIDITIDRIQNLNPKNSVEIRDLYENENSIGTMVIITLKLNEND
jgi:hypothetical protein